MRISDWSSDVCSSDLHISSSRDILTAVSKEVATFTRRAIKNIGKRHIHEVVGILLRSYHDSMDIIDKVEELTLKRSFKPVNRLKHWLKKPRTPELRQEKRRVGKERVNRCRNRR